MLRILHIAPQNYAGVPYDFYKMHNQCGDQSHLVTLHKNPLDFPEDICLNLPLPNFNLAKKWRRKKVTLKENISEHQIAPFKPGNIFESIYFRINDFSRRSIVNETIAKYNLNDYDIIHFDAGLDLFRNASQAIKWKKQGKKIVCCYYGSDLRIRGLIKELDAISDLNITSEYDHLDLKKDLRYLFYPYDPSELPQKNESENENITIIHTPTNRKYKGTELIISVVEKIKKEKKINFILLENVSRGVVLEKKSKSDICIDQVGGAMGGTGYGKAGLETLAMGIPTVTNMTDEYRNWLPENPFIVASNGSELYSKLNELIKSSELRIKLGRQGKSWVEKYHGYKNVNDKLKELYRINKII